MNTNFIRIVPLTFDERVAMYMKHDKEELARMLAESAKITNPDGCVECQSVKYNDNGSFYQTSID